MEFLKLKVEKMGHQIEVLTKSNKDMSDQLNDWRREVNKRLSRLEEQLNKPYTEENIETHVNVINKEEEQHQTTNTDARPDAMMESTDDEAKDHIPLA